MKEKTIQIKPSIFAGLSEALKTKFTFKKIDFSSSLKNTGISLLSMLLFLGAWQLGSSYLFNIEANAKIQKALTEQGAAAAAAVETCIASGDVSCQPNTLPSPSQVWAATENLIADHRIISQKKTAFAAKVAATNATRIAAGQAAITYTGRPSFVDQIFTSLKTVLVGFIIAFLIAVPIGVVIGLNENLRTAFNWMNDCQNFDA